MTGTLYVRVRNASGEFRWWAFTVRDRNAVLKEYRVMRHVRTRRSIARMHVVCLLFATVGGDCLPPAQPVSSIPAKELEAIRALYKPPPTLRTPSWGPSTSVRGIL